MSNEPQITAIVRTDGTGEVFVDGNRSEVHASDVAGARGTVIARVADEAAARDRPVRVEITDLDGVYLLIVHPDGDVESEGPVLAVSGNEDAPGQPEASLIPPPPFEIDEYLDRAEPEPAHRSGRHFEPAPGRRSTFRAYGDDLVLPDTSTDTSTDSSTDSSADSGDGRDDGFTETPSYDEPGFAAASSPVGAATQPEASVAVAIESAPSDPVEPVPVEPVLVDPAPLETPSDAPTFSPPTADAADAPTLDDFLQSRPSAPEGPAKKGWQGVLHRISGGLISPRPGKTEQSHRDAIRRVQRSLKGPRTIVVLNPKGGAHKTTATLLLAATFGIHRGGSTLAWDNNETRGTLGWRAQPSRHSNTAVDLLRDVGRFADVESARVGYLDNYVRGQGDAQFDVLASDEDAAASSTIDAKAFDSLHSTLSRFYRLLVIDTGNNMRASNWEAAVEAADQLVVVTTVNEETAASAAWLIDGLRQKGHQDKVSQAVTILSAPGDAAQPELSQRLHAHFSALTRVVLEVPYDPGFQSGGPLNVEVLSPQTREAWLQVTAAVADGL
ncbi:chromosome partitioning protein [Mycetocola sp. 2940]|uniref:MinD/ParA family ATP-binding protein n=1 Tax=Mycetocola sp. 2940 TaxID=3156452 RepID=UPI0033925B14